jgi:Holliday junction resolvase RusA-like endonuclease
VTFEFQMWAPGKPAVAGSKTVVPTARGPRVLDGGSNSAREHRANWRTTLQQIAVEEMGDQPPFDGPIVCGFRFCMPVPKSPAKRDWFKAMPIKRPDLTKLTRAAEDALSGIVWVDDSQIVAYAHDKRYAWDGRIGLHIMVSEIDAQHVHPSMWGTS